MSTPLFIREPLFFGKIILGSDISEEAIPAVEEALLIEKISASRKEAGDLIGRAVIYLVQDATAYEVKVLDLAIVSADGASQDFDVDLVVPVGCSLEIHHNAQVVDPAGIAAIHFGLHGGVLR